MRSSYARYGGRVSAVERDLLELGTLLVVAIVAARAARILRVPDVVLLLLAGLLLGRSGFHLLDFSPDLTGIQILVVVGASYILFLGGMDLDMDVLRGVWVSVLLLSTVGVLVTAGITALAAFWLFHLPFAGALLVASVISSTDPATLIPVLNAARVYPKVAQTIVAESAANDAVSAILTLSVLGYLTGSGGIGPHTGLAFLWTAGAGIAIGGLAGLITSYTVYNRRWFSLRAELVMLSLVIMTYALAEAVGGSGYIAVFTAGLVVGNSHTRHHRRIAEQRSRNFHHFLDTAGDLFRLLLFMLLGSQIDVSALRPVLLPALGVVVVFVILARPVTVLVATLPDVVARWTWRERVFLSWTRETGVIPAALVVTLAAQHAPYIGPVSAVAALAILITILLQGTTAGPLAGYLHLQDTEDSAKETPA